MLRALAGWARASRVPAEFAEYRDAQPRWSDRARPVDEVRFVVLDTETTGLDPARDRVLSVAAVGVRGFSIDVSDSLDLRVRQHLATAGGVDVHEITPGEAARGLPEEEVARRLLGFLGGAVLIGHHVAFDVAVLGRLVRRTLGFPLLNRSYDTVALAGRVDGKLLDSEAVPRAQLALDALCGRYGVEIEGRHTAMGDAFATALLFLKLLSRLKERRVRTLGDLLGR
jgi:DNA polymerase-3 subunit epsilon